MADYDTYHSLGHEDDSQDPSQPHIRTQPAAPQFRPPIAPSPAGYQQGQTPGTPGTVQYRQIQQNGYQVPQRPQAQEQSYFPPQGSQGAGNMTDLTNQMASVGLGTESPNPARAGRKKNRHAYHNLDQSSTGPQGLLGTPGSESPGQFPQQPHPYTGQSITPQMSQFPAPASNTVFTPGTPQPQSTAYAPGSPMVPAPSGPGVSAQGRVDPEQIPSIPRARDYLAQYYLNNVYQTMEQHIPPPGAIPFIAYDQGNSSPKYARLTLNNIPASSEALSATALPLGLVLQPLAPPQDGEQPIPVLDFGETGPPRCRRCRTYINPFMVFRSGGNKFVCNMCTFPNDVPLEYFAPTDPSGTRVDRDQRPELKLGTVEFMVPKEYWAKEPHPLHWLFLIDVSQESINRGLLAAFCEGILSALYGQDSQAQEQEDAAEPPRNLPIGSKVGFVSFDRQIHFYNCNVSVAAIPTDLIPS